MEEYIKQIYKDMVKNKTTFITKSTAIKKHHMLGNLYRLATVYVYFEDKNYSATITILRMNGY